MKFAHNAASPEFHLAQVVETAARSAGCPIGVFYLGFRHRFKVASTFGCRIADAQADNAFALLDAARRQPGGLTILHDPELQQPWLFGTAGAARFVAAVHVAYEHHPACGLLLVADHAPHDGLSTVQHYLLRANAAQITEILEFHGRRSGTPQPAPANPETIEEYRQLMRVAAAENKMLETENAALQAETQERRRIESRLNYLAFHDHLTTLYNRQFFLDRVAACLERQAANPDFHFAVLLLDLDRFKLINDSFGHRTGDLVLIEVAKRLRNSTRANDVVSRLGGDEFAVLIEGFDKAAFVASLAERVVEVVRQPFRLDAQEIFSAASIGGAYATKYYRLPEDILRDADIAMYEAKRRRKGFLIFDDSMHRGALSASQLRNELQNALARWEFFIEYQPIVDLPGRRISGVEALVRWQHPTRGVLLPGAFLGVAGEMGLLRQIGPLVLREACRQMREWRADYPDLALRLAVNISDHELADIRFIPQLEEILASTGLPPESLQLEVTESALSPHSDSIVAALNGAKALGVRFALDHFGTGTASLGHLDRYEINTIKLGQSFTAGIPERKRTASIVTAIIGLARALQLEVTAEGVETQAELQALLSIGCTQAQGFLLSRPLAANAVEKLLRRSTRA